MIRITNGWIIDGKDDVRTGNGWKPNGNSDKAGSNRLITIPKAMGARESNSG